MLELVTMELKKNVGFCDETSFREEREDKGKEAGFKHSFKDLPSECSALISFKADQL